MSRNPRPRWPDWLLAGANVAFLVALVPTLLGPGKPALATSASTAALLAACALAYVRLGAWQGALAALATALAWGWLAWQTLGWLP